VAQNRWASLTVADAEGFRMSTVQAGAFVPQASSDSTTLPTIVSNWLRLFVETAAFGPEMAVPVPGAAADAGIANANQTIAVIARHVASRLLIGSSLRCAGRPRARRRWSDVASGVRPG
jgi:hypothetical protein